MLTENVQAQATNWTTSGTGDWNVSGNWSTGVPTASSAATIASGGTAILSSATGVYNTLTVGNVTNGNLIVSGGALTGTTLTIGSLGTGAVTVSGGTYSTTTVTINSTIVFTGAATLSGGVLSTTSVTAAPLVGATTLTFNGGTLQASASNATFITGFPNGSITLGASGGSIDTNGFSIATANQISGSGLLTTTGTGILTLTANNTYTGNTTINSGTLQLGNNTTTGSILNNVTDNGVLVFDHSNAVTFTGTISGTGGVTQSGTSLLTFTANNTYSGTTTISTGTLQLGNAGTTGSIGTGNVADSSALVFNRTDAGGGVSGVISGTGTVIQAGTGLTSLTGNNIYTGTTTISTGTLQLGNGGASGSIVSNVTDSSVLVFNRSDAGGVYSGIISGTGAVIQSGSGLTTLTGNNTYTGSTTISSGTLQIGNGGTIGSIVTTAIADNGALVYDRSDAITFSGTISGVGSLTQAGTGLLTLTGTNTYTGNTTISSGTVQLGNGGTTGSIVGNVADSGTLIFNRSDAITFTGTISGTGAVTQSGTNSLIFTGNNTYTGATTIGTSGTLQLGNGGTTGSIASNLGAVNGSLVFNRSDAGLVIPTSFILGSGTVIQAGTGLTTLTGTNAYTGLTTISSGTLQLGNGGTTGAITLSNIADSSALVFNRSDSSTFSGTISGTGGVIQAGTGVTILTGANTYSGTTTISSGTLQLGSGGALGTISNSDVTDNGVLVFDHSNSIVYAGNISGTGSLTQGGTGRVILNGTNTYTGGTTISSGTLQIGNGGTGGSLVGNVTNNGVLAFNHSNANTFSGAVSGTGSLLQSGVGATTFTGSNSYTGGTTISTGNLLLGAGGTTGSIVGNVVDNGILTFDRSNAVTFSGTVSGTGAVNQTGSGQTTLTGNNTYTGNTLIFSGTLQLGNGGTTGSIVGSVGDGTALVFNRSDAVTFSDSIFGAGAVTQAGSGITILTGSNTYAAGTTISSGTLQLGNGGTTGSILNNVVDNGALVFNRSDAVTFSGTVSGAGSVTQAGTGQTILTGNNTYTGVTTISTGTLQLGSGGTTGSIGTGNAVDNSVLVFNRSDAVTFSGTISGTGAMIQSGTNLLTFTGNNTYTGTTTISNTGTLQLGNGATTGSIVSDVTNNGTLIFNRSDAVTFSGTVSGTGSLTQAGTGQTTLTANSTYTGSTTISSGTLQLGNGGTTGSIVTTSVVDNGTLIFNRSDTVTFSSTVSGTGSLTQAGSGVAILTGNNTYTGATTISSGTMQLGNGGTAGSIVTNVTDNGTLVFNRSDAVTFTGTISGAGPVTQAGSNLLTFTSNNAYTGVTTISTGTLQLGNGGTTGSIGTSNVVDSSVLVFNRSDAVTFTGTISGTGTVTQTGNGATILTGNNTYTGNTTISSGTLQLGNGGTTGSIVTTSIVDNGALVFNRSDAVTFSGTVSGTGSLTQAGIGQTTLTGNNTYTGATTISSGTLQLGNGGTTGSVVASSIVDNGALVFNRSDAVTFFGTVSGTGSLAQTGSGQTTLTGNNTYTGVTTISSGTLQLGNGGTTGSIVGNVTDNGTLAFNRSDAVTFSGTISGSGPATQAGTNLLTFTGNNTYTGVTTISSGTLQLGSGGTTGAIAGNAVDNSALIFNRSDAVTYTGTISGTGGVIQSGTNLLTFTGNNTYTGTTTISTGTLQLGNGGTSGAIAGDVADNGVLIFNRSNTVTFSGVASGAGNVTQAGTGATIFTGNNTYTGSTTISSGTLQLGNGGTIGSIATTLIEDDGALVFNRSDAITFTGTIQGAGSLTQAGSGTTILTGNNIYTGSTSISSGNLQLGNGGTTGAIVGNVTDNGALTFNRTDAVTFSGTVAGTGNVIQAGPGVTILTANNTYSGTTTISSGTLQIGSGGTAGAIIGPIVDNADLVFNHSDVVTSPGDITGTGNVTQAGIGNLIFTGSNMYTGTTTISSGTLSLGSGGTTGSIVSQVVDNSVLVFNRSDANNIVPNVISGTGTVIQAGSGATILTGDNAYTGSTTISSGTLQLGNGGTNGSIVTNLIEDDGAMVFNRSDTIILTGTIQGTGSLTQVGSGTTILTGNNIYTGSTTISAGTLQLGNGGATGAIAGNVTDNGALAFNRTDAATFSGTVSGTGNLTQAGIGLTILTANNTYSGITTISSGTLQIGSGGTAGAIIGPMVDNADLVFDRSDDVTSPGDITGTGNVTQAGSGNLIFTGSNMYTGITTISSGTLSLGNGGTAGSITGDVANNGVFVFNRSDANNVVPNVISGTGSVNQIGNGQTTLTGDNTYTGATTISSGTLQLGNGGTTGSIVTTSILDNGALVFNRSDAVTFSGTVSGTGSLAQTGSGATILIGNNTYTGNTTISSGTLQLGESGITGSIVGNVTNNGAIVFQRTDAVTFSGTVSGTGSLIQTGAGGVILIANNTYTGTTTISSGTLQLGSGGTTGSIVGDVIDDGMLVFKRSDAVTYSGTVSGAGSLIQTGTGAIILTANNTYTGGTTVISSGTLQLGSGGTTGSIVGDVIDDGMLVFKRSDAVTFSGAISGLGAVTQAGTGATTLTADHSYSGTTIISSGTLQLGAGGTTGSIMTDVTDNGALIFNRSNNVTFSGTVSGTGAVTQAGSGASILTANNTYTGGTTISTGTVQIGIGGVTGSIVNNVINNGALIFHRTDAITFSGTVSGTGALTQAGAGALILTANNTYTGATTISSGTLQLGAGGTTGSIVGDVIDDGMLVFKRSDAVTYSGTVSGAGSLIQTGTGAIILTANNTYTGGTTVISSGTLQLGSGGTTGSIVGDVIDDGMLVFKRSDAVTFSGAISGLGAVTQAGTGATTLTADHSYSGTTIISSGTLQLGAGGTSGSIMTDVTNNGALVFNRSNNATFSGTVSGTGSVSQIGTGATILTANNTYTGGTIISTGTLQIGIGGVIGSIVNNVINNGALIFHRTDAITFSGTVSGTGALTQAGAGALILTANNTYTGGTIISSGTLQLGAGGTTGFIAGNVLDNGAFVFNRSDTITFPGNISGIGSVIQAGTGTTILTGTNTYTGGTVILSGTLIGTIPSLRGMIVNNSMLVLAQSGSGTFNGMISGSGDVTINNPDGFINFATDQTYTGTTIIEAGHLLVNAQLSSSNVLINPTGALSGMGTIVGNVINSGILSPGSSPGTMTINGNYTQNSNSTLLIEIASDRSFDQVAVGGSAQLEGTLQVQLLDGFVPDAGSKFTILTTEKGVNGTFSQLNLPKFPGTLQLQVLYDTFTVDLFLAGTFFGTTPTQQSVADALNKALLTGTLRETVSLLGFIPLDELDASLEQLAPRMAATIKDITFNATNTQYGQITDRLSALRAGASGVSLQGLNYEPMGEQLGKHEATLRDKAGKTLACRPLPSPWSIFASASGVFSKIANVADLRQLNSMTGYFNAGADCQITEYVNAGIYGGYLGTRAWYADRSQLLGNGVKYGLYGTAQWNGFYLNAIIGGGHAGYSLRRSINIKSLHSTARSHPYSGELDSLLGGGYEFNLGPWRFGLNSSVRYTYLGISSFSESGAGERSLRVGSQNPSSLVSTLGASISYIWNIAPGYRIIPTVGLSWQHEYLNYGQNINSTFANGSGPGFNITSSTGDRNYAFGTAGITAQLGRRLNCYLSYNPQFGGGQVVSHGVLVGLTYNF